MRVLDRAARAAYNRWVPRGEPFDRLPEVIQRDWRQLVKAIAIELDVPIERLYEEK